MAISEKRVDSSRFGDAGFAGTTNDLAFFEVDDGFGDVCGMIGDAFSSWNPADPRISSASGAIAGFAAIAAAVVAAVAIAVTLALVAAASAALASAAAFCASACCAGSGAE